MNSMNDERFFDLAMKIITRQATDAERAELDALRACEPELCAEFDRLEKDVRLVKDTLPLVDAMQTAAGDFPAYAHERLQTKVRQVIIRHVVAKGQYRSPALIWRCVLGLVAAAAMILVVVLPILHMYRAPRIQLAMLDTIGGIRGTDTNEGALLRKTWSKATLDFLTSVEALHEWETKNKPDEVKVIYERAAAEVRVLGKWHGKSFRKTFLVEPDLEAALKEAKSFIAEQIQE